ncbi:phosphoribosyltransferase [Methylobacterium sp. J-059]|uniref:phosphoribosyltransferase n=1 Tax=Methylobacterium sp. J-059 TaxID=2836643 RepID=UPI001FBAB1DD|nr:phosphoribosyltransferase [Methylobacterium sp. J-059]MCJ2037861.1 phosphoribosyltransferase [Methylobacterium sp. J-059]
MSPEEKSLRAPWPNAFPPLLCHRPWKSDDPDIVTLGDHPLYMAAKRRRNAIAALKICDDLCVEATLDKIHDACHQPGGTTPPIVISPAPTIGETQNALALGYAEWLADQMRWEPGSGIYQRKTTSRDFIKDNWFRLANEPEFYGQVIAGRRYVIADDVCSLGGTITSLRGFIESQGGTVICMTTLAARDGSHAQISLAAGTLDGLTNVDNGSLPAIFGTEMGYELSCLTEHEGRFLLSECSSADELRARVHGARDA